MVFSSTPPEINELAKVWFRVFDINNDQQEIFEIESPKEKRKMLILILMLINSISDEYDL